MAHTVRIPTLGLTTTGGTLLEWRKAEGDRVAVGEVLFDLETEKAVVEVEAEADGYLRGVALPAGSYAAAGESVAWITASPDEPLPAVQPAVQPAAQTQGGAGGEPPGLAQGSAVEPAIPADAGDVAISPAPAAGRPRPASSPYARRLAGEAGIDWRVVAGHGPGGRVVARDVQAALARREDAGEGAGPPDAAARQRLRQAVARRTALGAAIPQFAATRRVDMSLLRSRLSAWREEGGAGAGYTDLLLQASLVALSRVPQLHAHFQDGRASRYTEPAIGLAVATQAGLLVPLLRVGFSAPVAEIAAARAAAVGRARAGRLVSADLGDPTYTLSNLGPLGVDRFAAILDPGQAAILAVGAIRETPVVREGALAVALCCDLTLTVDHRVGDGADAAAFLAVLAAYCEQGDGLRFA